MKVITVEQVQVGDREVWTRTITDADVVMYGGLIGDRGPLHLDEEFAASTRFGGRIAYGMQCGGYIGATLAQLLGVGSAYVSQNLRFRGPVRIGDRITVETVVTGKDEDRRRVYVDTTVSKNGGEVVVEGEAELVMFPVDWTP
ncbi:MaoC family dehydratase [Nocardioides aquiterrae]|uniref:MaoC family dehydratase n=1 Tax=Nocardioides aquiterrae TaxID=203799 RepID=A0ABP4F085_9ACTN